jgi:glycosyl transferase, family 25
MVEWGGVADAFYCITLRGADTRRRKLAAEFERVGLHDVQFIVVDRDHEDTRRGCFSSHKAAARRGLLEGRNRVCIFEDDVVFSKSPKRLERGVRAAVDWLSTSPSFSMLFLGHLPVRPLRRTGWRGIRATADSRYLHAYVLSREGMARMCLLTYKGRHVDYDVRRFPGKFAVLPMIAYQDDCVTTNNYSLYYTLVMNCRNLITCKTLCLFFEKTMRIFGARMPPI